MLRSQAITDGWGVDVACADIWNAPGMRPLKAPYALRPGGTLSSVGVSGGQLKVPPMPVVTTLRPGGKDLA
jgi:hypothetical protein